MSDIVERLRNLIEADDDPAMKRFYADCLAEIERLNKVIVDIGTYENAGRYWEARWRDEEKEVERLHAELAELRRWKALDKPIAAAMSIANSHLAAERERIERLRAEALEAIATARNQCAKIEAVLVQLLVKDMHAAIRED